MYYLFIQQSTGRVMGAINALDTLHVEEAHAYWSHVLYGDLAISLVPG